MRKYVKFYLEQIYGDTTEVPLCELCGSIAVDVHHIYRRGMGGSKQRDKIELLMGLCRIHHEEFGDKKQHYDYLFDKHFEFLSQKNVIYDETIKDTFRIIET
jgi:hypothetical protein